MHKSVFFRLCAIAFNIVYSAARSDSVQRRSIAMMRFVLTVFCVSSKGWACAVSGSAFALCIVHACLLFSWARIALEMPVNMYSTSKPAALKLAATLR